MKISALRTINDEAFELLETKGYSVIRKIGEGNTRNVYEVEYNKGSLKKRRVAKIPKPDSEIRSITTRINRSKRDLEISEIDVCNNLSHPHITDISDTFKTLNGTITIEESFDGISLEDLIRMGGSITNPERVRNIFSQIREAYEYMHDSRILHKDVKPSNILVNKQGFVKVTDLQNAGSLDSNDSILPTRGGTSFTNPRILNRIIEGLESKYTIMDEFYALGATLYYTLTGENINNTNLSEGYSSNVVYISGIKTCIVLSDEGKSVDKVDIKKHNKKIKKSLKKVPRNFRNLLKRCLILDEEGYNGYRTRGSKTADEIFKKDLNTATRKTFFNWKAIRDHSMLYSGIAGFLTGISGGTTWVARQNAEAELRGSLDFKVLRTDIFGLDKSSLEFIRGDRYALATLRDEFGVLKKRGPNFEQTKSIMAAYDHEGDLDTMVSAATNVHQVPRRLLYSIVKGLSFSNVSLLGDEFKDRYDVTLVPRSFVDKICDKYRCKEKDKEFPYNIHKLQKFGFSAWYLKNIIATSSSIPEVFARYFASDEDLSKAKTESGTTSYFPRKDSTGSVCYEIPGYADRLPQKIRRIIDNVLAVYYLTDNEGETHYELIGDNNIPISGLEDR